MVDYRCVYLKAKIGRMKQIFDIPVDKFAISMANKTSLANACHTRLLIFVQVLQAVKAREFIIANIYVTYVLTGVELTAMLRCPKSKHTMVSKTTR